MPVDFSCSKVCIVAVGWRCNVGSIDPFELQIVDPSDGLKKWSKLTLEDLERMRWIIRHKYSGQQLKEAELGTHLDVAVGSVQTKNLHADESK